MRIITEFKEFAMRGNIIDIAVGIVIGSAFGKIVSSFVSDLLMPAFSLVLGIINVADKSVNIAGTIIKWGSFLQNIIDFTIIAFAVFLLVKLINTMHLQEIPLKPKLSKQEELLVEIRDLLQKKDSK